ncbi:MAG: hypothetical protein R3A78_01285 [Polyangiales bacterium]
MALLLAAPLPAAAQIEVRIHAETRMELVARPDGPRVRVRGRLLDDMGDPLEGAEIALQATPASGVRQRANTVVTDAAGVFELTLSGNDVVRVLATYTGDRVHDPVSVEARNDPDHAPVTLEVSAPNGGEMSLDAAHYAIAVRVRAGGTPVAGIRLRVADELGRELATTATGAGGQASIVLDTATVGGPGVGRLRIGADAGPTTAAALTEVPIVRVAATTLTLGASSASTGEHPTVEGQLRWRGGGLTGRAVGVFAGERHVATALTDDAGHFEAQVPPANDAPRTLVARFTSDTQGFTDSASAPLELRATAPERVPVYWLFAPPALLLAWLFASRRRTRLRAEHSNRSAHDVGFVPSRRAVLGARTSIVRARVVSARGALPLTAKVSATGPGGVSIQTQTSPDGHFVFAEGALAPGPWTLEVEAPGHAPERTSLVVPHHGEWMDAVVRLV